MVKEKFCCVHCFRDEYIQQHIRDSDSIGTCDYCESEEVNIAAVVDVESFIRDGFNKLYEDAANSVGYESAEGGYQLPTSFMDEILGWELSIFGERLYDPHELKKDLGCYDGIPYVRKDPYGPPSGGLAEIRKWEDFCNKVKTDQRFTVLLIPEKLSYSEQQEHPGTFLAEIADAMAGYLVDWLETDTKVFRARRIGKDQIFGHHDLTAPRPESATNNRMSPAGISLFYGTLDPDTALAEIRPGIGDRVAIACFQVRKPLRVIDLTKIPPFTSIFSEQYEFHFEEFTRPFLEHFSEELSKPIRAEDSPIDYVPTQVFTEFIRMHKFWDDGRADGILYKSSMRAGGISLVLFKGQEISCEPDELKEDAWLTYVGYEDHTVMRIDFHHSVSQS